MNHYDCVIIGGGITGLAAAHRLKTLRPDARFMLLEAGSHVGGLIATESVDGFTIEASADSFLSRKPEAVALAEELGLRDRLQGPKPENQQSWVLRYGKLHKIPEGLTGLIPANLEALTDNSLLSPAAVARIEAEIDVPPADANTDESVADFITRRMGREAFVNLIEPLMGGIFGGRADLLSLNATFPQLRKLEQEYGSLLRGLNENRNGAANGIKSKLPPFLSFKGGMAELISTLQAEIREENIRCNAPVESVEMQGGRYRIMLKNAHEPIWANAVLSTTPAIAAAKILQSLDSNLSDALQAIPYSSSTIVTLAYDEKSLPRKPDGYGYIIPKIEGREALACTWTSAKWENRAPAGKALFRVFLGRFGDNVDALDDATIKSMALNELQQTLAIGAHPEFVKIQRWTNAKPQYTIGHLDRIQQIQQLTSQHAGLKLAGAYFRGVGVPDCIREGRTAVESLAQYLFSRVKDEGRVAA